MENEQIWKTNEEGNNTQKYMLIFNLWNRFERKPFFQEDVA